MSPLRDHEAYHLFDGGLLKDKKKEHPTRQSPKTFSVAECVDDSGLGLYVTTCQVCGDESPPSSYDALRVWREEHLKGNA